MSARLLSSVGLVLAVLGVIWAVPLVLLAFGIGLLSGFVDDTSKISLLTWPGGVPDLVRAVVAVAVASPGIGLLMLGLKLKESGDLRQVVERNRARMAACAHEWQPCTWTKDPNDECPRCGAVRPTP